MEQLFPFCTRFAKTGATILALVLSGHTILAQSGSTDTLSTYRAEEISRGIALDSSRYYHQKKDQLNKGLITSPEQLLAGNIAGLQVMAASGQPGAPIILRQHAVNTAFGDRAPLILLDGMPMENQSPSDNTGYLNFINPEDIASITFMDGAASVAVYGGRAANGVLAITSKRAGKGERTKVTYSSTAAISQLRKKADVLTADEFRTLVQENYPEKVGLLGDHNTDWQDEIYRNAFSHNQHISLSGTVFKSVPYRVSAGYLNENGILKTARNNRKTLDLSLNPSLLQNHLTMDLNFRAAGQEINVADKRAVTAAWAFDPTQPVYQENNFGGYYTYMDENREPAADAPLNPLSVLEQRRAQDNTKSIMAQAHLKYIFPFLPALNLHVRYGLLNTSNSYDVSSAANMAAIKSNYYYSKFKVDNEIKNKTSHKEAYITYKHPREILQSSISLMAGVALNNLESESYRNSESYGGIEITRSRYLFGRENKSVFSSLMLNHKDRFLFETAFSNNNYSNLPSGTAAATYSFGSTWNVMKEKFMQDSQVFSSLKLQANFISFAGSPRMRFPKNTIINPSFSPVERINSVRVGTRFGLLHEKIKGDVSLFRNTQDGTLLLPAPIYTTGYILTQNSLTASGAKASLQYLALSTSKLNWSFGANVSYQKNEIKELANGMEAFYYDNLFIVMNGEPVHQFEMLEQLYDSNGKPIEGAYKRAPNDTYSKIAEHTAEPDLLFGLSSDFSYNRFSLSAMLRGSTGNYVYSIADARKSYLGYISPGDGYLQNLSGSYLNDGFENNRFGSSYYIKNASFLRLEFLQLGYDFGALWKDKASLKVTGTVQNALVITKYKGQDPEVVDGIDDGQYPVPTTFSLGVNLNI